MMFHHIDQPCYPGFAFTLQAIVYVPELLFCFLHPLAPGEYTVFSYSLPVPGQ